MSYRSVVKTGGGLTVTALGPGLPLLLEDLGVGRDIGMKKVAIEHLSWRMTSVVWGCSGAQEGLCRVLHSRGFLR